VKKLFCWLMILGMLASVPLTLGCSGGATTKPASSGNTGGSGTDTKTITTKS